MFTPALAKRISIPPQSSIVRAVALSIAERSVTSTSSVMTVAPSASSSFFADSFFDVSLAQITIVAPARANPLAQPNPIPPLPPVITATFPAKSKSGKGVLEVN